MILPLLLCSPLLDVPRDIPELREPPSLVVPATLVVVVVCDQLIPEQLERLAPLLDGGLARFWNEGRAYPRARLGFAITETGPGHATLSTGCLPRSHGIPGNLFFDREQGRRVYCLADREARSLTSAGAATGGNTVSPSNLRTSTLAEILRRTYPGSQALAISMKDRASLSLAGPAPALALWWDRQGSGFMSSTHYGDILPKWVLDWNRDWAQGASGWVWTPSFEGDPSPYGTAADDRPGESPYGEFGTTFPYTLPRLDPQADAATQTRQRAALASSVYGYPLGDALAAELAMIAVDALELGQDDSPDLLAVSFSGCDAIGHSFGPYSWEVTDLVLRTDDALGKLLDHLDATVGPDRWIGVLSADHGVLELPESLQAQGIGARRIGRDEIGALSRAVTDAVEAAHGHRLRLGFTGFSFALDMAAVTELGLDPAALRRTIAEAAVEASWVEAAYTLEQLSAADGGDPWLDLYRNGFFPGRCEDVLLRHRPWTLVGSGRGTTHGSPYPYDRRVPLAFLGAPFAPGRSHERVGSEDAAPTLLGALGLAIPESMDGRDLLGDTSDAGSADEREPEIHPAKGD